MEEQNIVHSFDQNDPKKKFSTNEIIIIFVVAAIIGIGTGLVAKTLKRASSPTPTQANPISSNQIKTGDTTDQPMKKTFKDSTEGIMKNGGIDGEGQYHLERPGGDSQNVYLTSSIIDLSLFIGKKIKVWGQTNDAKKAGWLMDVGKLTVE